MHQPPRSDDGPAFAAGYLEAVQSALAGLDTGLLSTICDLCIARYRDGAQFFACGNGGSSATASHFIEDLAKGIQMPGRRRIRAIALTDSVASITAWANDTDYANVFAAQLENFAEAGDVLIALSGSGNSPNIIRAVDVARELGVYTIGFAGYGGGLLAEHASLCLVLPSRNMQQVEDVHLVATHLLYSRMKHVLEAESPVAA